MNENLICPVCGKTRFGQSCDYGICKFCGWENDGNFDGGGANELSLADYKIRYRKFVELNPNYIWKNDGLPEISDKDEFQLAHKHSFENFAEIKSSQECGCFYCLKIFKPKEIKNWIRDKNGKTALCPYCGIDSVLPDKSVSFDLDFLEEMHKLFFE